MATLDWVILIFFIAGIFGIVCWVLKHKKDYTTDFFLSGKCGALLDIVATFFATKIGTEHFLGLAGAGTSRCKAGEFIFQVGLLYFFILI